MLCRFSKTTRIKRSYLCQSKEDVSHTRSNASVLRKDTKLER